MWMQKRQICLKRTERVSGKEEMPGKDENMSEVGMALAIMWKGMLGIFVAVAVIMLIVYLLGKLK